MKPPFWIEADAKLPLTCHSVDGLISTLEDLQRAYLSKSMTSVGIHEAGKSFGEGDIVGIGIGIDPTYVTILVKPCDGEFYESVGDHRAGDEFVLGGFCNPVHVDWSRLVPWRLAVQAVREFVEFGRRTASIRWLDCEGKEIFELKK